MRSFACGLLLLAVFVMPAFGQELLEAASFTHTTPKEHLIHVPGNVAKVFPDGVPLGIGSGLVFGRALPDGGSILYGVSDLGPSPDSPQLTLADGRTVKTKIYPTPKFSPLIMEMKFKDGAMTFLRAIPIKKADGSPATGIVPPPGSEGSTGEYPLDMDLNILDFDPQGLDPEGIAIDRKDGNFWIGDEYGPFLVKIDKDSGRVLKKYGPRSGLPEVLAQRTPNRGFESVAVDENNLVYALAQSVLRVDGEAKKSKADFIRLVVFDPVQEKVVKTLAYPLDAQAYKKPADAKIGDLTPLGAGRFILIEQGNKKEGGQHQVLYTIDINKATDIGVLDAPGSQAETADLAALQAKGVVPVEKELLVDLRAIGYKSPRAEGLAILQDGKTLIISSDNNFGITTEVINPAALPSGKVQDDIEKYTINESGKAFLDGKEVPSTFNVKQTGELTQYWVLKFKDVLR